MIIRKIVCTTYNYGACMITPSLGFILLFVENPQKSSLFYQDLLHIKPLEESPTFVLFGLRNGTLLGFWSRYTAEPHVHAQPGAHEICFETDDVDVLYATWGEKRLTIAQKPTDLDFGRTFVILDPDGHRIRVYKLTQS